jgi:hypothetical protein
LDKKICVIGAGPSGITAIKNIVEGGFQVKAFDFNSDVGGNWIYNDKETHSSVFETTHIISSKSLSQFEDFHFSDNVADYPSHDELRQYFQSYAKNFGLYKYIQFNTLVKKCERLEDNNWEVTTSYKNKESVEVFSDLVVCNGHHWKPNVPKYSGNFNGSLIHSHNYKKASPFINKNVLVIGGGNSACDVAVETSRVSNKTFLSWRRGYRIIPKFFMGKPSDVFASYMSFLPISIRSKLAGFLAYLTNGSNSNYGLLKPEHKFGETHPTINSELLYKIRHGKIFPKNDINFLKDDYVYFKDGSQEKIDVIIACTGFVLSHPFFNKNFIDYTKGPVSLYLKMFHPDYDNLFFIGMFQPFGCIWPGSEQQSKLLSLALQNKWKRPKNIIDLCKKETKNPHIKQIKTDRHRITVDYHQFIKELKYQINKSI